MSFESIFKREGRERERQTDRQTERKRELAHIIIEAGNSKICSMGWQARIRESQ